MPRPPRSRPCPLGPASEQLSAVVEKRRSVRSFHERPVPLLLLAALLGRAARVRGFLPPLEHQQTQRPSPSGGGRHSLEIYVLARAVDGLPAGAHHYDPFDHALEHLAPWDARLDELTDRLITRPGRMDRTAPVSFYLTSYTARTSWKYGRMALSLIYRDAGCLMQTLCLTATDLGLAACPIGAIDAPVTAPFLRDTDEELMHVGGFALGLPAGGRPPADLLTPARGGSHQHTQPH
nr:SagB family peptide dehydrogenase [Streptomyces durmitorensis]